MPHPLQQRYDEVTKLLLSLRDTALNLPAVPLFDEYLEHKWVGSGFARYLRFPFGIRPARSLQPSRTHCGSTSDNGNYRRLCRAPIPATHL